MAVSKRSIVSYDPRNENYCDKTCFDFLFIKPIIGWGLVLIGILIFIGSILYGLAKPKKDAMKDRLTLAQE